MLNPKLEHLCNGTCICKNLNCRLDTSSVRYLNCRCGNIFVYLLGSGQIHSSISICMYLVFGRDHPEMEGYLSALHVHCGQLCKFNGDRQGTSFTPNGKVWSICECQWIGGRNASRLRRTVQSAPGIGQDANHLRSQSARSQHEADRGSEDASTCE